MSEAKNKVVKIAILGTGFGAMHAALKLQKKRKLLPKGVTIEVDLISRVGYFWLVTMAHEVATGNLLPDNVVQPVRSMPTSVYDNFIQAEIKSIDAEKTTVEMELLDVVDDQLDRKLVKKYDYIISSLGSEVFYFGVKGADKYSLPIKTLDDVKVIKNRILQSFEDAELLSDESEIRKLLHFVIVGGGATGVEVAGELADMINGPLSKRFSKVSDMASITIIHGGNRVGIPGLPWMSQKLEDILQNKHCVKLKCNSYATEVSADGVYVGEELVPSKNVIWSGGVKGSSVEIKNSVDMEVTKQGRVEVESDLSLQEHDNIFIIGDQASVKNEKGKEYPMRAQFAVRQAAVAVGNIIKDIKGIDRKPFIYDDKGVIIGLGNGDALADVLGMRIEGKLAYWMYKIIYIPQIIGARAKVKTIVSWIMNMFTPRDLSKL